MRCSRLLVAFCLCVPLLFLHGNGLADATPSQERVAPAAEADKKKKKKCFFFCKKWGRNCVLNSRTGFTKCRRSCEQFVEECPAEAAQ